MSGVRLDHLAALLGGQLQAPAETFAVGFAADSRSIEPGDAFLAIRGENVDGHRFALSAIASGAVVVIAEETVAAPHILVDDLVAALARMASALRASFTGPVVGVTGSAGKTTTKEFLAAALSPLGPVLKNPGNRNTEFTAPLVWAGLDSGHQSAVVELGMRGFGQIRHLASFSRPTIGVVTNIGDAHLEKVGSREGIAKAKGELLAALPPHGWAVLPSGDDYLELLKGLAPRGRVRTFGFGDQADCRIVEYEPLDWSLSIVSGTCSGKPWQARVPSAGRHMALDAAAAVLAATLAGVEPAAAALALGSAVLPPLRMEIRRWNGATIVLDAYNASPPSLAAALETFGELPAEGRRLAVVGEMRELGDHAEEGHRIAGRAVATAGLDSVLFVGPLMRHARDAAIEAGMPSGKTVAATEIDEVAAFLREIGPGDVVLVKGSRALELERSLESLEDAE